MGEGMGRGEGEEEMLPEFCGIAAIAYAAQAALVPLCFPRASRAPPEDPSPSKTLRIHIDQLVSRGARR